MILSIDLCLYVKFRKAELVVGWVKKSVAYQNLAISKYIYLGRETLPR